MVQKRPHSEELYEVSSKEPRRLESSDEMVSSLEFPYENVASKLQTLGEFGQYPTSGRPECDERLHGGNGAELGTCPEKDLEASVPGSICNSSWDTSTTSEENIRLEARLHILLSPDHHNLDHPERTIIHVGDIYSSLSQYPPRKLVPVGTDHQAEIPEWGGHSSELRSFCSGDTSVDMRSESSRSHVGGDFDDERRFAGACIIPMPELDMSENDVEELGAGRINCSCEDGGSVRCVQQHITEAREKLRTALGQETFVKLGFCDMGEVVTEKWSEEEELIFYDVVSNNPATLGKNFWDYLAVQFPSRTKKETVSYYFNVFMLRKRALQNRSDPLNVDSDNDEWEGTEDSADCVIENGQECDGSGVESPVYEDDFGHRESYENMHESSEDGAPEISVHDIYGYLGDNKVICNVSETFPPEFFDNHSGVPTFQPSDRVLSNESGGHDIQGAERASENAGIGPEVASEEAKGRTHLTGSLNGMGSNSGLEFLLEPCSSKEWNTGYLTCPKNEDFLPTCSVIEEVFGDGAWNYGTTDG